MLENIHNARLPRFFLIHRKQKSERGAGLLKFRRSRRQRRRRFRRGGLRRSLRGLRRLRRGRRRSGQFDGGVIRRNPPVKMAGIMVHAPRVAPRCANASGIIRARDFRRIPLVIFHLILAGNIGRPGVNVRGRIIEVFRLAAKSDGIGGRVHDLHQAVRGGDAARKFVIRACFPFGLIFDIARVK